MTAKRLTLLLPAALVLLAAALAAQWALHPHTPYKLFVLRSLPALALWLAVGIAARRRRLAVALTAGLSFVFVAGWELRHVPPLAPDWTAPAMTGVWLAALLVLAACTGALNKYFRHGPMTALALAAVLYALASGYAALPFGAEMMTAGMLWLAVWQGVYLYNAPASLADGGKIPSRKSTAPTASPRTP